MSKARQLELNFDDPVEYLVPPFHLRARPHLENPNAPSEARSDDKTTRIEIALTENVKLVVIMMGVA